MYKRQIFGTLSIKAKVGLMKIVTGENKREIRLAENRQLAEHEKGLTSRQIYWYILQTARIDPLGKAMADYDRWYELRAEGQTTHALRKYLNSFEILLDKIPTKDMPNPE